MIQVRHDLLELQRWAILAQEVSRCQAAGGRRYASAQHAETPGGRDFTQSPEV